MVKQRARRLRGNPTEAEKKLWSLLRRKELDGHRFRRQVPLGPYVADFVCLASRLVIEVDGGQHAVSVEKDRVRSLWLEDQNFRVLRFWNNEVLDNPEGVRRVIQTALAGDVTPLPNPPPQGGREA